MKKNFKKPCMFQLATLLAAGFVFILQAGFLSACSSDSPDDSQEPVLKTVNLSGTINVTFENAAVPHVEIGVDAPGQDWIKYTRLDLPPSGEPWSIKLPAFKSPTQISFRVKGYDDKNILLFEIKEIDPPVSVYDNDVPEITLDLGNIFNNEPKNIIPLEEGKWCEGDITIGGNREWYSFNVESGTKYYLWWNDIEAGDGTKMLDIDVYAFDFNVTPIPLGDNDKAWEAPVSFTADLSGIVYLRVRALNNSLSTGTYAVVYSKNSVRPDNSVTGGGEENPIGTEANPIPLTSGVWKNDSLPSSTSGRTIWYSFSVTKGNPYYVWWNDKGEGDNTKTLDIKVDAYYIEDGHSIFVEADSAWDKPMPSTDKTTGFTAESTGKVKLKVTSFYIDDNEGTFAIAYSSRSSTGSTRP